MFEWDSAHVCTIRWGKQSIQNKHIPVVCWVWGSVCYLVFEVPCFCFCQNDPFPLYVGHVAFPANSIIAGYIRCINLFGWLLSFCPVLFAVVPAYTVCCYFTPFIFWFCACDPDTPDHSWVPILLIWLLPLAFMCCALFLLTLLWFTGTLLFLSFILPGIAEGLSLVWNQSPL